MEQPQEPAWLRTYKSRAAPFSPSNSKPPARTSTPPQMLRITEEPDITVMRSKPDPDEQDQPNTYSVAFPSTISLGLKSFGRMEEPVAQPDVHPALRGESSSTAVEKAASMSSSTTVGAEAGQGYHAFKKMDSESKGGWRTTLKGIMRRLACNTT